MGQQTKTYFPATELEAGKTAFRESWNGEKEMRMITPDEWDGPFPISRPYLMVKDSQGWGLWCSCQDDLLATDWVVVESA